MPLANLREIRERIEKERKAEKKQERSNTYKGEKFKGHYQGYEVMLIQRMGYLNIILIKK